LSFENAKLLDKGEGKAQASYSSYYGSIYDNEDKSNLTKTAHYNNNFGIALGYGISNNFNIGVRYERMAFVSNEIEIFGNDYNTVDGGMNYIEVGNKIRIKDDKLAFGIPLSLYIMEGETFFSIDPRLYWTYRKSNKFETTLTPKVHLFFIDGVAGMVGLTLGLGLSNNLDKWAFRPEFGYDGYFSFGFGVNIYIKKQPQKI
jgi:hypothetical protein